MSGRHGPIENMRSNEMVNLTHRDNLDQDALHTISRSPTSVTPDLTHRAAVSFNVLLVSRCIETKYCSTTFDLKWQQVVISPPAAKKSTTDR